MADFYNVRDIVTHDFYNRHIVLVHQATAADLSEHDLDEVAKKLAEGIYQARDVAISTVLVLGQQEAMSLKGEVNLLQAQYNVDTVYTTSKSYPQYGRGTRAGTPAAKKRATYLGCLRFKYKVMAVEGEHGPPFKIGNYDGPA